MLLSEFLKESVAKAKEAGFNIHRGSWFDYKSDGSVRGMCPFSCAYYNCTGEFANPDLDPTTGEEIYEVFETLQHVILPVITREECCTNIVSAERLADFIHIYDDGDVTDEGDDYYWSSDDMIRAVRMQEEIIEETL